MKRRDSMPTPAWQAAGLAGFAVMLLAAPTSAAAGEMCPTPAPGVAVCGAAPELAHELSRRRVGRTLATNPANERLGRLNAPQSSSATMPFAMTPDGDNTNFNTSLTQWGSALSAADQETLKQAKDSAGNELALPKALKSPPRQFDVWAKGRREMFREGGAKEGNALTTYVGADYRMSKNFLFGGMVDDARQTVLAAPDQAGGKAFMAGPYMAYRLTPNFVFDAKAGWGTAQDSAVAGTGSARFATQRLLSEAKLSGHWGFRQWQFTQSGAVTYLGETSGATGNTVDVTRFSVGPE
jgi:hypothetical protein